MIPGDHEPPMVFVIADGVLMLTAGVVALLLVWAIGG